MRGGSGFQKPHARCLVRVVGALVNDKVG